MYIYRYKVWDPIEWKPVKGSVLVKDQKQFDTWIESRHPKEERQYGQKDTLEILEIIKISMPHLLYEKYE